MRIVIYNSPCAPGLVRPVRAGTGINGAFLYETAAQTGSDSDTMSGCMEIARGKIPPGGVVCVCGRESAKWRYLRRMLRRHGRGPIGQGPGRQQSTSHYGINLFIRAWPGIYGDEWPRIGK